MRLMELALNEARKAVDLESAWVSENIREGERGVMAEIVAITRNGKAVQAFCIKYDSGKISCSHSVYEVDLNTAEKVLGAVSTSPKDMGQIKREIGYKGTISFLFILLEKLGLISRVHVPKYLPLLHAEWKTTEKGSSFLKWLRE